MLRFKLFEHLFVHLNSTRGHNLYIIYEGVVARNFLVVLHALVAEITGGILQLRLYIGFVVLLAQTLQHTLYVLAVVLVRYVALRVGKFFGLHLQILS